MLGDIAEQLLRECGTGEAADVPCGHATSQRSTRTMVAMCRARPRAARQVQRAALVYERQRDELGEATRSILDAPQHVEVADPVMRLIDVAVHHRRTRPQTDLVGSGDD